MPVAEAQARISSREFAEWQAYDRVEPFGEVRADFRAGIIASTIVNLFKSKGDKPARPDEFLPTFGEAPAPEAPSARDRDQETAAFIAALKSAYPERK